MPAFLTVKEAAELTGKSPSSIRRVLYPIIQKDKHPDREHIQPSVDDAQALRTKGENFAWRLSEELVRREMPVEPVSEETSGTSTPRGAGSAEAELLAMLRRELDIKNQQITQQAEIIGKQMELVNGLGERLREGNILIASLQQRLALLDGRETKHADPGKAKRAAPTPEKGSTMTGKTPRQKKSFLARIFG